PKETPTGSASSSAIAETSSRAAVRASDSLTARAPRPSRGIWPARCSSIQARFSSSTCSISAPLIHRGTVRRAGSPQGTSSRQSRARGERTTSISTYAKLAEAAVVSRTITTGARPRAWPAGRGRLGLVPVLDDHAGVVAAEAERVVQRVAHVSVADPAEDVAERD